MFSEALAVATPDCDADDERGEFVDFPEARELLATVLEGLAAEGGLVSLHFEDEAAPQVLHRMGCAARDQVVADAALRLAARECADGLGDGPRALGRLGSGTAARYEALSACFSCRESRTSVVVTALLARDRDDGPRPIAALKRVLPMLTGMFRLWQRHRSQVQERHGLAVALDAVEFGIILVDREGQIGFANAAAAAMLAEGRFLRRRGRMLTARHLADTMKVQSALAAAIACNAAANDRDADDADAPEAGLLQLISGGDRLVLAAIPADRPATEPGSVAAMLVAHNPDRRPEKLVAPVCKLFGMSAVETRLAAHLIAGRSLAEASQAMRIKEQTARGYLKQVFLKTGVNRQSELVRLLMSSLLSTRVRAVLRAI